MSKPKGQEGQADAAQLCYLQIREAGVIALTRLTGDRKGEVLEISANPVRLGRAPRGNNVPFDREKERVVGNFHAEIRHEDGRYFLVDLQSTNGTFVNGQRISRHRLSEGDVIGLSLAVGGPTLRFGIGLPAPELSEPVEMTAPHLSAAALSSARWTAAAPTAAEANAAHHDSPSNHYDAHHPILDGSQFGQTWTESPPNWQSVVPASKAPPNHFPDDVEPHRSVEMPLPTYRSALDPAATDPPAERVLAPSADPLTARESPLISRLSHALASWWPRRGSRPVNPTGEEHSPQQDVSDGDQRFRLERFNLEEALKEKPTPERIWMAQHRWMVRLILVSSVAGWYFQDSIMRFMLDRPVEPIPMVAGRPIDEDLISPPGWQNQDVVKAVTTLYQRVQALPPQQDRSDGSRTLRNLRPVVRRAGEDSNFVPADFVQHVADEITRIKDERNFSFMYLRAKSIRPQLVATLAEHNLVELFSFIPWIESEFSPNFSNSRESRVGLWGLTPDVAKRHGLTVSDSIDERLDPKRSTLAACSYLAELVAELRGGSFTVPISSYRDGPKSVRFLLAKQPMWKLEEFSLWHFHRQEFIPDSMMDYLARVLAVAVIHERPEYYGLPP